MVNTVSLDNDYSRYFINSLPRVSSSEEISVFDDNAGEKDYSVEAQAAVLEEQLNAVTDKNGCKRGAWDSFKGFIGLGTSSKKCESYIEKFKNGEMSFDEALAEIEKYDQKQDSSLNLFSNIATSVMAIGAATLVAVATGGAASGLVLAAVGAAAGATTKAVYKYADRATNNIKGDESDVKQIARDALSGAVTGSIAVATMGTGGSSYVQGASRVSNMARGAVNAAKTGVKTGAISGAANYTIDCAFDDKEFNLKDMAHETVVNAAVGGTVGAIMGSANGFLRSENLLHSGGKPVVESGTLANASLRDVAANSACSASYKILNQKIKNA